MISQVLVNFLTQFFCWRHKFHFSLKSGVFLPNDFLENLAKWSSVIKLAVKIDETQATTCLKNQVEEIHLSDSITERCNCVKYLGSLIDKHWNFHHHFAEVVKKLLKRSSVISRLRHYVKKPVLLQYYNTYIKTETGYGLLIYGCDSKNRLTTIFILEKRIIRQNCFQARC